MRNFSSPVLSWSLLSRAYMHICTWGGGGWEGVTPIGEHAWHSRHQRPSYSPNCHFTPSTPNCPLTTLAKLRSYPLPLRQIFVIPSLHQIAMLIPLQIQGKAQCSLYSACRNPLTKACMSYVCPTDHLFALYIVIWTTLSLQLCCSRFVYLFVRYAYSRTQIVRV